MNIFEQLKEKKTPKNVKQFALNIKPIDDDIEKSDLKEQDDNEDPIEKDLNDKEENEDQEEGEEGEEKKPMPKHVLDFIDKRHENHIDRFLILQRIKKYKEKPQELEPLPSVLQPILKDTEIQEENVLKDLPTEEEHSLVRKDHQQIW